MIKKEIIDSHLKSMYENLEMLDELKSMPLEQFKNDKKTIKLCERCLQLAIQSLLDISHYIIANKNLSRPNDNREAILTLGAHKIIPDNFAQKIAPMANLRNLLIHEYLDIDPAKIHAHIQNLEDFRQFSRYILKYIDK
jgi:uncharacterized protein YutE (UPF0331/DUF86 family)